MERTLIKDTVNKVDQVIRVSGYVHSRRDHGKIVFLDLWDRSGTIQVVMMGDLAGDLRDQDVVNIEGKVAARPEKLFNLDLETGKVELQGEKVEVLAKAAELPFDMGQKDLDLQLPTLLDHRSLTLRHPKVQAIFKVQSVVIDSFREFMKLNDFFEFQAPSIVPAVAEGGAEVFKVNYFDYKAFLSQSPQLYKQIVMAAFERVFSVNKVFRAEPSVTSFHLTEIVSLDAEMGFIESWKDVQKMADQTIRYILQQVDEKCQKELKMFEVEIPKLIDETPTMSLKEAQEKIFAVTGRDNRQEKDLTREDEKEICRIVKEETGSDLVYIYGYPTRKKPFYVYPNPEDPEVNEGMDLLCRGIEWLSGGRRINNYDQLMKHVKEWEMDPESIRLFTDAYKYGCPPEGGFAFGAERITMQILGLGNIREASMFPRDMERVDTRLNS